MKTLHRFTINLNMKRKQYIYGKWSHTALLNKAAWHDSLWVRFESSSERPDMHKYTKDIVNKKPIARVIYMNVDIVVRLSWYI